MYKKSLEGKEKEELVQKEKVRVALATGAPLPTELRRDAEGIKSAIDLEDDRTAKLRVRLSVHTPGVLFVCLASVRER